MENNNGISRRKFISVTARSAAIVTVSSGILESCAGTKALAYPPAFATGFDQTPLPYSYDALENVIDARTMEIHYTKHAAGYSKALKELSRAEPALEIRSVEPLLANISKYSTALRNNAGGHYNHEMFWKSMRPKRTDNQPTGKMAETINTSFGSFANFKTQFADAGKNRFGSGWAWLYRDGRNVLRIGSTANQDNPLMNVSDIKGFPLLGLDVWEHAYYLKYQNKRGDYIENWWNVVNWDYVQSRLDANG